MLDEFLAQLRKTPLGAFPTRLEFLERLSRRLGGPDIWIKRDDCTGLGGGGNKVRKLEYLLADARAQDCDTVITAGAIQSNHARLTAAAAAKCGLECILVLTDSVEGRSRAYKTSGNALLDRLFGAEVHVVPGDTNSMEKMQEIAAKLRGAKRRPYVIPIGGSNAIGTLGYVAAAGELVAQCGNAGISPACVMLPTGSGATQAGMVLGLALSRSSIRTVGFSVGRRQSDQIARLRTLVDATSSLLRIPIALDASNLVVDDRQVGLAYGIPTTRMVEAVRLLAEEEGLLLDPVYSGKAMAGLLAAVRDERNEKARPIVFLHTGGSPSLFAYDDIFGEESWS